ncbi:PilZ domain-containing protein [Sphingomonas daechungensis]|uniref:PilZ domain-containing protein n=1 Tax=Sphingomonas daechungensis TaxID=1176646 RepID=UPI0031EA5622
MIRARMRSSSAWHDVCILNVSLHGLGVQSAEPPARGTYVEIRRGRQTIVARVAWNKGHRAGLRSQDPIFLTALLNDTSGEAPAAGKVQGPVERRHAPRPSDTHAASRLAGRAIEFAGIATVAAAIALAAFGAVAQAFNAPMAAVREALGESNAQPTRG